MEEALGLDVDVVDGTAGATVYPRVANGVVDMRQIRDAMRNFDDLDRDKGGFITKTDIEGSVQIHS